MKITSPRYLENRQLKIAAVAVAVREYVDGERVRFRIVGRERYPSRSYTTTLQSLDTNYLPTSSYYAVKDAHTDDFVIPYDTSYTKISCDSTGSFFDIRNFTISKNGNGNGNGNGPKPSIRDTD